jgi:hypothetical protein
LSQKVPFFWKSEKILKLTKNLIKMPRYGKCCRCFSARTGALILAILGIGGAGFGIISDSVGLGVVRPQLDDMLDQVKEASMNEFEQAGEPQDMRPYYESYWNQLDMTKDLLPYIFVVQIVGSIFNLAINGSMLYGITKNSAYMILPWLVMCMIGLVAYTIISAGGFIVLCVAATGGVLSGLIFIAIMTPILAFGYYLWCVVQSVYLDIKEGDKPVNEKDLEKSANAQKYAKL